MRRPKQSPTHPSECLAAKREDWGIALETTHQWILTHIDRRDPEASWRDWRRAMERERKLALLTSSKLGALRHAEEVLARLGQDYDDVDLKLALGEMFFRGGFAQGNVQVEKLLAGLPANAPASQIRKRLGIQMRENRGILCPAAVTRIRRALEDRTFPSRRKAAEFSGIDEKTLRNVLQNERAEEGTLFGISKALKISIKTLLSDPEPPKQ